MDKSPIISVVIPCYNSALPLTNYLNSLSGKIFADFEFVIVDDCSNEENRKALQKFKDESKLNINLISNEINLKQGESRNTGIKASRGLYVTFLDADDTFTDDFFKNVLLAVEKNPDAVIFDYNSIRGKYTRKRKIVDGRVTDGDSASYTALITGAPWGKIYKKSIIVDNNIKFSKFKRNEDLPFTKSAISFCKHIIYIHEPLYNYIQNPQSIMHQNLSDEPERGIEAINYIKRALNKELPKEVFEFIYFKNFFYKECLNNLKYMGKKEWKEFVERIKPQKELFKNTYYKASPVIKKFVIRLIYKKRYTILRCAFR